MLRLFLYYIYIYVCAIKVEVYVISFTKGLRILDMNIYHTYVEVYVNLQVVITKVLKFYKNFQPMNVMT